MIPFFVFAWPVFSTSRPLRPPMWGGEPYKTDPEAAVTAAAAGGGDEVHRGVSPSAPQQPAVEVGKMSPQTESIETDIDVKIMTKIYHLIDDETEEYVTTRFEFEAIAIVKVNEEKLHITSSETLEDKIWDIAPEEIKNIVEKIESDAAEKAFNFRRARRELLDALKAMKVTVDIEKVVEEGYFDDDP